MRPSHARRESYPDSSSSRTFSRVLSSRRRRGDGGHRREAVEGGVLPEVRDAVGDRLRPAERGRQRRPGAARTRRRMRGRQTFRSISASPPPNEWPTMSTCSRGPSPSASIQPATICAYHASSYPASGRSECPCPGRSKTRTRRLRASSGAICRHVRCESLRPCRRTTAVFPSGLLVVWPNSTQWSRTPSTLR